LLIALGIVFLMRNIGVMQGDVWDSLWRLWPVVLIVIGLDSIYKREGLAGAAFMIGLGIIFLLANLGYLTLDVWQVVIHVWPVLIIAVGFDMIVGRRSLWASLAGLVIVLAILAGALWMYGVRPERGQIFNGQEVSQALEGASKGEIELSMGAGTMRVQSSPDANMLISGEVTTGRGSQLRQNYSQQAGVAVYRLSDNGVTMMVPGSNIIWDLGLAGSIPLDLKVNFGAGTANVNLKDLQIEGLEASMGVGSSTLVLPSEGSFSANVSAAIGTLEIVVPQGMEVRIDRDTALASMNVPDNYQERNDIYQSPGYESAQDRIDLKVNLAIGTVNVTTSP